MKKVLYSLLTLAAALTVTSCLKEVERSADPVLGGPTVEAEFTLNLDQLLTKAYADGTKATKLSYAFFDAEGTVVASLTATKIAIPDANKINVKLSKGVAYTFVAWVESESSVYTISSDFKTVTMETAGLTANNDNYDAFYGTVAISSDDTKTTVSKEVELKRPFAQINLLVPDANTVEYTSFKSAMTVKSAYASMNLLTGALTGDPTDISFASAAATEPTIKTDHKYLAMNYVFASADAANFPVSFTVTPDENAAEAVTVDLASVSLKRNRRTNLVGNIFKTQVDGSITITINPDVVDPAEEEVLPTLQLALPAGATSTGPSTVNLPLTAGAGPQTVGMTSPNSTGAVSFGQAANTSIAEVTDNGNGTATVLPKANGETTFVGHIAAGETKAATSAVDVVFTVVVSGGAAPTTYNVTIADMTNGTVTSDKATAAAGETVTLTITPDENYVLDAIAVSKSEGTVGLSGEGNTRTFSMPAEPVTVSATFTAAPAQKQDRNLAFKIDQTTVTEATVTFGGDDNIFPQLTGDNTEGVVYSLENVSPEGCVTINESTGAISLVAAGSATVKATAPETSTYNAGTASYALTVNAAPAPAPTKLEMSEVSCTDSGVNENSLNFSWMAVANATGYMVSVDGTNYGAAQNTLTYDLTGLEPGTEYTIHVKAIGDGTNYLDSDPVDASGTTAAASTPVQTVATPTFTPAAGTYTTAQNVTIECETAGASIYYTTDGTDPTTASTLFESAIAVSTTTTIKAIAVKEGMTNSAVAEAKYSIEKKYLHAFTAKPSSGNNNLSGVTWTLGENVNLGSYNSNNYAGVQIGTKTASGTVTMSTSSAWNYEGASTIKQVKVWLNAGTDTPSASVTIGGKAATSDNAAVEKNSAATSYLDASVVSFTPADDGKTGVVSITVSTSSAAGYWCAIEIVSE